MGNKLRYPIFQLSKSEFHEICNELLFDSESSHRSDRDCSWCNRVVAIDNSSQAGHFEDLNVYKFVHRIEFSVDEFKDFIDDCLKHWESDFKQLSFVTSAPIHDHYRFWIDDTLSKEFKRKNIWLNKGSDFFKVIGQEKLFDLLDSKQGVASKYFENAMSRARTRKLMMHTSILVVALSTGWGAFKLHSAQNTLAKSESDFSTQIASVEDSLRKLRDLEAELQILKFEIQQKSVESIIITKEYEDALKLKSITSEQLEQIHKAVTTQGMFEFAMNFLVGIATGLATSFLYSIATDRWKRKKTVGDRDL